MNNTTNKIAVHTVPSITREGHRCLRHMKYVVVVGSNPLGIRGGHCGNWVAGKVVAEFWKWEKAQEFAEAYKL